MGMNSSAEFAFDSIFCLSWTLGHFLITGQKCNQNGQPSHQEIRIKMFGIHSQLREQSENQNTLKRLAFNQAQKKTAMYVKRAFTGMMLGFISTPKTDSFLAVRNWTLPSPNHVSLSTPSYWPYSNELGHFERG
ncbi:hypothetical protein CEXT_758741 [Caerostris extrusa]|uniref:Uncharacterized protein n=1 Tax=Caerostris extrusa TaxID=172846 RepID=A0AAV4X5B3_CAEEX|nr:hypothetical protein CEXT_758741 [Caerostris extrusa]